MRDIFGDDDGSNKKADDFGSLLESSLSEKKQSFETGDRAYGEILSITKDEVFLSLGPGLDGVVPKNELLEDGVFPFKVGEHLELYVARKNEGLYQLTAKKSGKALAESLEDAFDFGTPVDGRVTEQVNGGYRVDLQGKIAFCPISQIDYRASSDPTDYLNKKFEFVITKFENRGKNIVVSRRKALELNQQDSIADFTSKHKVGQTVAGKITRLEGYGAFVELMPGLEGLIPISELSFSRIGHPQEVVQLGNTVTVKILQMEDRGDQFRISLSKKQADDNPWDEVQNRIQIGSLIKGRVTKCMPFGAFVEVQPGIEGLVPLSEMSATKRVNRSDEVFKAGDTITVLVKSIQPEERRITLSYKDAENASENNAETQDKLAWQQSQKAETQSLGTLGDQFKDLMKNFKK